MAPSLLRPLFVLTSTLVLAACAGPVVNFDALNASAERDASVADESSARTISRAQAKIELGNNEKLSFYAPDHLILAQEQLIEAREMHSSGEAEGIVKTRAMLAIKTLEAGLSVKKTVLAQLKPTFKHRQQLLNIKADQYFPDRFAQAEVFIKELIALIEANDKQQANQQQAILLADMNQLEVDTISYIQLQPIKNQLAQIDERNGSSVAPQSWQIAQRALATAEQLIAKTPRAVKAIAEATDAAQKATDHADNITRISNEIANADDAEAEMIALRMEQWLYQISVALKHKDIRHQTLDQQAKQYADSVEALMRSR